jgi:hypothetical protein
MPFIKSGLLAPTPNEPFAQLSLPLPDSSHIIVCAGFVPAWRRDSLRRYYRY